MMRARTVGATPRISSVPRARAGARTRARSLALAAALTLASSSAGAADYSRLTDAQLAARGFKSLAKSSALELYASEETGFLAVRVLADGTVRYSSPLDWEEDEVASGFVKNSIPSLLSIRSKDRNGQLFPANSYVNAVRRSGLTIEAIPNGARLTLDFEREGIEIPVDAVLEGSELVLSVQLDRIKEETADTGLALQSFTLAPYFGAAGSSESGYFLVPDGSGALIRFGSRNTSYPYQQYIYGRDPSMAPVMRKTVTETACLPVFGLSTPGSGIFAVIEEGAARAWINAESAYQKTGYNAASASCIVRDFDNFTFRERTGTPRDIPIFEKGGFSGERFAVRYFFLRGKDSDYVGMAGTYRSYLQARGRFPSARDASRPALFLDFIGAGPKVKPVLGIPADVTVAYTPFDSARSIIEDLRGRSVDAFIVKYEGWTRGGMMDSYPATARAEAALGGDAGLRRLSRWLSENGIPFYPSVDFVNLYKPDLGHLRELATNRAVNHAPAKIAEHRLTTFDVWADGRVSWTLRAPVVEKSVGRFMASRDKGLAAGLAPDTLGNLPCSDFGSGGGGTSRVAAASTFRSLLAKLDDRGLALSRPLDYALEYADFVSDLPTASSRFDAEDESVPFYQILLRGYLPFSNLPGNRDLGKEEYLLGLLETGAFPSYLWAAREVEQMRDTRLQYFVNVAAEDWIGEAAEVFARVAPILRKVAGKEIAAHEILGRGLRRTTFEGGFEVVVNYSDKSARLEDGRVVAPLSYAAGYPGAAPAAPGKPAAPAAPKGGSR
jgi:hypothetical protein